MPLLLRGAHRQPKRSSLRVYAAGTLALSAVLLLSYTAFQGWTRMPEPSGGVAQVGNLSSEAVSVVTGTTGAQVNVGGSWLRKEHGLWWMMLTGSADRLGYARGILDGPRWTRVAPRYRKLLWPFEIGSIGSWWDNKRWQWHLRSAAEQIPRARLLELVGFTRGIRGLTQSDNAFELAMRYQALYDLNLHEAPRPLLEGLAVALWGNRTSSGRLLIARSVEAEGSELLARHCTIQIMRPKHGLAHVTIGWPGLLGALTGINDKQMFVAVNAAKTDEPPTDGVPALLIARHVLEHAEDVDQALRIVGRYHSLAPMALMIADGSSRRAIVVETEAQTTAVRYGRDGWLAVTNHFQHPKFEADAQNDRQRRYTSSGRRLARLEQWQRAHPRKVDEQQLAGLLRDRQSIKGDKLPWGHGAALNRLRTVHGVIIDLEHMVLWIARPTSGLLGPMLRVDLEPLLAGTATRAIVRSQQEAISAHPEYGSTDVARYRRAIRLMMFARQLRAEGAPRQTVLRYARRATLMAPRLPRANKLFADLLWEDDQHSAAKRYYRRFVGLDPPLKAETEQAQRRLAR